MELREWGALGVINWISGTRANALLFFKKTEITQNSSATPDQNLPPTLAQRAALGTLHPDLTKVVAATS